MKRLNNTTVSRITSFERKVNANHQKVKDVMMEQVADVKKEMNTLITNQVAAVADVKKEVNTLITNQVDMKKEMVEMNTSITATTA